MRNCKCYVLSDINAMQKSPLISVMEACRSLVDPGSRTYCDVMFNVPIPTEQELLKVEVGERGKMIIKEYKSADDKPEPKEKRRRYATRDTGTADFRKAPETETEDILFPHDVSPLLVREFVREFHADWVFVGTGGGGCSSYGALQEGLNVVSYFKSAQHCSVAREHIKNLFGADIARGSSEHAKSRSGQASETASRSSDRSGQ